MQRGGVEIFGYPRTEAFNEDGLTVQYFQRARFELHADKLGTPYEVQLTLIGDILTKERGSVFPQGGAAPDYRQLPLLPGDRLCRAPRLQALLRRARRIDHPRLPNL